MSSPELDAFELAPLLESSWPDVAGGVGLEDVGRLAHQELITGDQPAAGQPYIFTVPGAWDVRPLVLMARLTTSAAGANRSVVLEFRDADGVAYDVAGTDVQVTPSSSVRYCFRADAAESQWPVDDVAVVPMQPLYMWPTYQLALKIVNADPADQLSTIRLTVEKFSTARRRRQRRPSARV